MTKISDLTLNMVYTFVSTTIDLCLSLYPWAKFHLPIKAFYGTSPNAVYCQIWIAICTNLLIAIAKKKLDLAISLYTFAQTMGLTLFEKTPIKELFNSKFNFNNLSDESQLSFWNS